MGESTRCVLDPIKERRTKIFPEDFGEDKLLTSHMGVAYASGLSKNSTWSDPDAVVPVMKVSRRRSYFISVLIQG